MSRNLLLIHGAWHGGWSYDKLTPFLAGKYQNIIAPTLYGLDSRGIDKLPNPEAVRRGVRPTTLEIWTSQVIDELDKAGVEKVHVVAHSHGGLIAQLLLDKHENRIKSISWLDAAIGPPGKSPISLVPEEIADKRRQMVREEGNGLWIPVGEEATIDLGINPDDVESTEFVKSRLVPHPFSSFESPLYLDKPTDEIIGKIPSTYFMATKPIYLPLRSSRDLYEKWMKTYPSLALVKIPTGHDMMVTLPKVVAENLVNFHNSIN